MASVWFRNPLLYLLPVGVESSSHTHVPKKQVSRNQALHYVSQRIAHAASIKCQSGDNTQFFIKTALNLIYDSCHYRFNTSKHLPPNHCVQSAVQRLLNKIFVGHDSTGNRTSTTSVTRAKTAPGQPHPKSLHHN